MHKKINNNLVLLVGKGYSGITSYLKEQGYEYIILRDKLGARHPEKKIKRRVVCDFSSREQILRTVDAIDKDITCVLTHHENYVLATAWINEHLGLPGLSPDSAKLSTDKVLMREAFSASSLPLNPDFTVVDNEQTLRMFADSHNFPLILKPANLVKSMLVTKNADLVELMKNYHELQSSIDSLYAKYSPNRQPKVILEEFLEGSMHTVAAFVDHKGEPHFVKQIVDVETARDAGFDDNFLYSRSTPSRLNEIQQKKVFLCAEAAVKALRLRTTPAHIEIMMTKNGPRIIEIGARIGGYRERMHRMANGIDLVAAAVDTSLARTPKLKSQRDDSVIVLELFPRDPGIFAEIKGEKIVRELPSCVYFSQKNDIGSYVGKASEGYKCSAVIILHSQNPLQLQTDAAIIKKEVLIHTIPPGATR